MPSVMKKKEKNYPTAPPLISFLCSSSTVIPSFIDTSSSCVTFLPTLGRKAGLKNVLSAIHKEYTYKRLFQNTKTKMQLLFSPSQLLSRLHSGLTVTFRPLCMQTPSLLLLLLMSGYRASCLGPAATSPEIYVPGFKKGLSM